MFMRLLYLKNSTFHSLKVIALLAVKLPAEESIAGGRESEAISG